MTKQRISQLWWRHNQAWVGSLIVIILGLALLISIANTQQWHSEHRQVTAGYRLNRAEALKHPNSFKVAGKVVSERAYYDHVEQFFAGDEFSAHRTWHQTTAHTVNDYFYVLAILAGVILAFWERRTHYGAFLLNLGATRWQIWRQQLATFGYLTLSFAGGLVVYYAWIWLAIPNRFLQNFDFAERTGNGLAITLTASCLLALGWLAGNVNQRLWAALVTGLLAWRALNGFFVNGGLWFQMIGIEQLPAAWLASHYGIASALALGATGLLLGLTGLTFRHWSADTRFTLSGAPLVVLINDVIICIGVGTLLGDALLNPVFNVAAPWYEPLGSLIILIGLVGWQCWTGRRREVQAVA